MNIDKTDVKIEPLKLTVKERIWKIWKEHF